MAMYFDGTAEIQGDGLQQTLYLMNPIYAGGYSDAPAQPNMASSFINSANGQHHFAGIPIQSAGRDEAKIVASSSSPSAAASNGSVFMGSKYLKAAQQLLDEVVNVGNGGEVVEQVAAKSSPMRRDKDAESAGGECNSSGAAKRGVQLTTREREELQITKAKLVNMLDEVEQRWGQYHHQMQIVASSLEAVAGFGSARAYTALALQTMSKQFQCLRDAVSGQIRATSKSLGEEEEDCLGGRNKSVGGSRLRFVDHHLRQQRALQQLGVAEHDTWRPQRGLPERAVSVLRAWLFEHFLHPYPKDSDKHMLAKETGLTRSQVSNWFINARVRLWKPMVEEMYLEETKEQEEKYTGGGDDQKSDGSEHSLWNQGGQSPTRTDQTESFKRNQGNHPVTIQSSNIGIFDNHNEMEDMSNHGSGFGASYQIGQFDHEQYAPPRFGGNGVSLTLGLPDSQRATYLSNHSIPLGRRIHIGMGSEEISCFSLSNNNNGNNPSASHLPNAMYESINIQNRKRFAAQLMPDYVA